MKKEIEVIITLKDTLTGEKKEIQDTYISDNIDGFFFYWEEGGMSCDCNRFRRFYKDYDTVFPCGEDRFELLSIKEKMGMVSNMKLKYKIEYIVTLKDNNTGEVKEIYQTQEVDHFSHKSDQEAWEFIIFYWTEHSMGGDYNRFGCFYPEADTSDWDKFIDDYDESMFQLLCIKEKDGERYVKYEEDKIKYLVTLKDKKTGEIKEVPIPSRDKVWGYERTDEELWKSIIYYCTESIFHDDYTRFSKFYPEAWNKLWVDRKNFPYDVEEVFKLRDNEEIERFVLLSIKEKYGDRYIEFNEHDNA